MNVAGNIASGFECPRCGSREKQDIVWLDDWLKVRLHCAACEYIWTTETR